MEGKDIVQKFKKMEGDKSTYLHLWQEIADFMYPQMYHLTRYFQKGEKRRRVIFDNTAERALDTFASSMLGLLANPATKFIAYQADDPNLMDDRGVQIHYEAVQKKALAVFSNPKTKFFDNLFTCLKVTGAFGTAPLAVDSDEEHIAKFRAESPRNFNFTEDYQGNVADMYLSREMTTDQLKESGWDVPEKILQEEDQKTHKVIRYLKLNPDFDPSRAGEKYAMYQSYHVLEKTGDIINTEFAYTPPMAVARWDRLDFEKWADSPARVALADTKMLNAYKRAEMVAIEKTLNPPIAVSSEAKFGKLDTSAGAVNVARGPLANNIAQLGQTVGNIALPNQWAEGVSRDILSAFYVDIFQTAETPNITATEAQIRFQEKLRGLSPKAAKLQSDLIGPIAERVYALIVTREELKQAAGDRNYDKELVRPEKLRNANLSVSYLSPISQAQRAGERTVLLQTMQDVASISQIDPAAMDIIDIDASVKELTDISGIPEKLLRPEDEVEEIRAARSQQQAVQQVLSTAQQAGEAGKVLNEASQGT